MDLVKELSHILKKEYIKQNEPMKKHTTFRVGGPADYFVMPEDEEQVREIITLVKKKAVPFYVIGNGSNLLVGDKGIRGVVIQIYKNMSSIRVDGEVVYAQAGALLSRIAAEALAHSLSGFEFASGIPGTLGGAVIMNAGAYGSEMKDVLVNALALTQGGEFHVLPADWMRLGYRSSIFEKNGDIIINAELQLCHGDAGKIRASMEELKAKRLEKQPLEYASAGSTFKRPEGFFAGKLIEEAGLRGVQIGGAQVSEKHCGFVINRGNATASEIVALMEYIIERVRQQSGVVLEPEVKRIGEF